MGPDPATTATTIAERMGRNRNSIIGKAHAMLLGVKPAKARAVQPAPGRFQSSGHGQRVRKAFASKGDDTTLSRFVKIKGNGPPHMRPKSIRPPRLGNPSIEAGRSIFWRKGISEPGKGAVLVSGHSNVKIGITVCERWKGFENFLADMGERPVDRTLDRENPFGHYEPKNCRWATRQEQADNKRESL